MTTQDQLAFAGVDACSAPHLVSQELVQSAVNLDFDMEPGAASARRGSILFGTAPSASGTNSATPVTGIFRNFNNPYNIDASPFYVTDTSAVYRGVSGTYTQVAVPGGPDCGPNFYRQFTLIPSSPSVKDDGTAATDWIKQSPSDAPVVTVNTLTALTVTSTYTAAEGALSGTSTDLYAVDATTFRLQLNATPTSTNLDLNGTHTIGDYGVDCLEILFSDPAQVTRISRDYSIGDANFTNYWHTEFTDGTSPDAQPDAAVLIDNALSTSTFNAAGDEPPSRDEMASEARTNNRPTITLISSAANSYNLWAVPRTKFSLINKASVPTGWTNIQAMRVIVECSSAITIKVKNWAIYGANDFAKNDPQTGYSHWVTWATVDSNGGILGESAPSPASTPTRVQNGQFKVTWSNTATGSHGLTHSLIYSNGGYLNDIYAVGTVSGLGGTFTDTLSDIGALSVGRIMQRNVMSRAEFTAFAPSFVSEPFNSRVFVSGGNTLRWSLPGVPDVFPRTSYTRVSHDGDLIRGHVVWGQTLVVVNRDSVYEMKGNTFEGANANWSLARMGCRHGSKASGAVIKTPYGIPLVDYEGLFMYIPGQGIDQAIEWVQQQIGDAWLGSGSDDPAAHKGSRVPAFNKGSILNVIAAFANEKLYQGMPTGTNTYADTVFVLNFRNKKCQWYQYQSQMSSLFWDAQLNRMLAGLVGGKIMQIEQGNADIDAGGTQQPIVWSMKTRAWSLPTDNRMENVAVDIECPNGSVTVAASYDRLTPVTLGTLGSSTRDWYQVPQTGTLARNVAYVISGTEAVAAGNQTVVHQLKWSSIVEPERLRYFRTEEDNQNQTAENVWTAQYSNLEIIKTSTATGTGTVLATTFIDGVAAMTNSFVGPGSIGSGGKQNLSRAFPWQTFGNLAYTVYTVTGATDCVFKHSGTVYTSSPEPDRLGFVSSGVTTYPSLNFLKTWVADINPLGTCTGDVYADDVKILTSTFTGTNRKVFNVGLDLSGATLRTAKKVEVTYTALGAGSVLKHYATSIETDAKPYAKQSWTVSYKKSGGATQLDMARFWSADIEVPSGPATLTAIWDIDGTAFCTNTIVTAGRVWADRIAFPPGGRGRLFQLRVTANVDIEISKANLDIEAVGIKGLSRRTYVGTPVSNG